MIRTQEFCEFKSPDGYSLVFTFPDKDKLLIQFFSNTETFVERFRNAFNYLFKRGGDILVMDEMKLDARMAKKLTLWLLSNVEAEQESKYWDMVFPGNGYVQ